jgi:hypothetical protein
MSKTPVLSKDKIFHLLTKEGCELRYYDIQGKVYVYTSEDELVGAVRFETYLKIVPYTTEVRGHWSYLYRLYIIPK